MDALDLIKKEALRRGFSSRTISSYCYCTKMFLQYCKKEPKFITKKDIRDYLDILVKRKVAGNTLNVYVGALKFLFEEVLSRKLLLYIKYSKVPKNLPTVLTQNEAIKCRKKQTIFLYQFLLGLKHCTLLGLHGHQK